MADPKRILVLAHTLGEVDRFHAVAEKLALELLLACSDASAPWRLDFATRDSALRIVEFAYQQPLLAILPMHDDAAPIAARASSMLALPFHTPRAADSCANKSLLLRKLVAHKLRPDTPPGADTALGETDGSLQLTCLMSDSRIRVLVATQAIKGRILLSTLSEGTRQGLTAALATLIGALGLKHGPVHVLLDTRESVSVVDVSLGSVVPHTSELQFRIPLVDQDLSFEEVVVRNALGLDVGRIYLDSNHGVTAR